MTGDSRFEVYLREQELVLAQRRDQEQRREQQRRDLERRELERQELERSELERARWRGRLDR